MENFSFNKGLSLIRQGDAPIIKEKIMKALKITTRAAWWQRRNGIVEPKVSEAAAIERIFAEYGVKEVWGDAVVPSEETETEMQ